MSEATSVFWRDLQRNLEDPEFRKTYIAESKRIQEYDAKMNAQTEEPTSSSPATTGRNLEVDRSTQTEEP